MNKSYIKKLKSIKNFEDSLNKTLKLVEGLIANIYGMKAFLNLTLGKRETTEHEKKMVSMLTIDKSDMNKIFEMGYITLYSHFEFFMYDFLKDLFLKFPKSLNTNISFDEIRNFDNQDSIVKYVIDKAAIKNSYDQDAWLQFIKNTYDINFFKTKKDLERLCLLNELRNIIMHSNGKTNSKFSIKIGTILKTTVPINKKFNFDRKKYFYILYNFFENFLEKI